MSEFIREYHFYLNEGVIILAALVGLLTFKKYKKTVVKYFIYFLVYVVIIELVGFYPGIGIYYESFNWISRLTKGTLFEQNYLWYSIFWMMGSAIFISFYFKLILKNERNRIILKYLTYIFILASMVYFAFNYEVYYYSDLMFIRFFGVFIIGISIILYFFEILKSDKIITFHKSINFYIAAVFFLWFLIRTPLSFYQIYYSTADWNFVFLKNDILLFCNMFLYLTFIISLLWCKPQNV
jgi:hypothetical protein